jgi:hypothetical protein
MIRKLNNSSHAEENVPFDESNLSKFVFFIEENIEFRMVL